MKPLFLRYAQQVHAQLYPYFANWPPDQGVELGDYGLLDDTTFVRHGSTSSLGIDFNTLDARGKTHHQFCSDGSAEFRSRGEAIGLPNQNARLEITFKNAGAVFFDCSDCNNFAIEDKLSLGNEILTRYRAGVWDLKWVVVTDLVRAGTTTIAIASDAGASMTLEAESGVPKLSLATAKGSLHVTNAKHLGYRLIAKPGLSPLFRCATLRHRVFAPPEVVYDAKRLVGSEENEEFSFDYVD